jgi:hypothetical protein
MRHSIRVPAPPVMTRKPAVRLSRLQAALADAERGVLSGGEHQMVKGQMTR